MRALIFRSQHGQNCRSLFSKSEHIYLKRSIRFKSFFKVSCFQVCFEMEVKNGGHMGPLSYLALFLPEPFRLGNSFTPRALQVK